VSAQPQPHENLLTPEGYEALCGELTELTLAGRARAADELQRAREIAGDAGDNVELLEARREHERLEARIATVEELLRGARAVEDADLVRGTAGVGSEVEVEDVDSGTHDVFGLVGSPEAAPVEGRISVESPVGRALVGCRSGDVVEVDTPRGTRHLHVRRVRVPRRLPARRRRGR
jgi:transcription elongation factor GreA